VTKRWIRRLLVVVLLLVVAAGAFVGVQLHRQVPQPQLQIAPPRLAASPVADVRLPWPDQGQAALSVQGVGASSAGPQRPVPVGSVAKIMTAYLTLLDHPLKAGQSGPAIRITARQAADYALRRSAGSESLLPVSEGEVLTERQALDALLVPSANNIADVLADWTMGSSAAFVQRMNDTARRLGLSGTRYADTSGYNAGTVSTATDQVRLTERALLDPVFVEIVGQRRVTLPLLGAVPNYNALLGADGVFEVKTGSTRPAGGNIVFASRQRVGTRTVTFVGAVFGQRVGESSLTALGAAFDSARRLLVAAQQSLRPVRLLERGTSAGSVRAPWGPVSPVVTGRAVELLAAPGARPTGVLQPGRTLVTVAGQTAATLTVSLGRQRADVPLVLVRPVPPAPLSWRLKRSF